MTDQCDISRIRDIIKNDHSSGTSRHLTLQCPTRKDSSDTDYHDNGYYSATFAEEKTTANSWSQTWPQESLFSSDPPLIGYRYNYQKAEFNKNPGEHKLFMNDSLFLPFDVNKYQEAKELQRDLKDYNLARQEELKPTSLKDLQAYHNENAAIAVKQFKGNLISVDVNEDIKKGTGLRLSFVLSKGEDGNIP